MERSEIASEKSDGDNKISDFAVDNQIPINTDIREHQATY